MSEVISVYADGGVILKNPSAIGGTWAFCFVDSEGKRFRKHAGVLKPEEGVDGLVTNNITELFALCSAIWSIQTLENWESRSYHFYSDSNVTVLRVFRDASLKGVPDWLREFTGKVRILLDRIEFQYTRLDGHPDAVSLMTGIGKRGGPVSEHTHGVMNNAVLKPEGAGRHEKARSG